MLYLLQLSELEARGCKLCTLILLHCTPSQKTLLLNMTSTANHEPGVHITPPLRPTSPVTAGIKLNHLMLRITDPVASLKFYNDCMGMHTIFIFNTGMWTIYYLGPRDVGMENMGTASGLLELYHIPGHLNSYKNGNENGGEGFGHIGFTVPDVEAMLKRVSDFGYKVIKPLGEAKTEQFGLPDFVKGVDIAEGYKHIFKQLAFVVDPDVSTSSLLRFISTKSFYLYSL